MDDFYALNSEQTDFCITMLHAYRESMRVFLSQMSQEEKDRYNDILIYHSVTQLAVIQDMKNEDKINFKNDLITRIEWDISNFKK